MSDDDLKVQHGVALVDAIGEVVGKVEAARKRGGSHEEISSLQWAAADKVKYLLDQLSEDQAEEIRETLPPTLLVMIDSLEKQVQPRRSDDMSEILEPDELKIEEAREAADEVAKEVADETAKEAAEEAANEAAEEAYKETYNEVHKEAYDEAFKEAYDKALAES